MLVSNATVMDRSRDEHSNCLLVRLEQALSTSSTSYCP
jgi:hypothetical protein